ncbi:CubicO group peptidase, beta-lactamase class C family [Methanophagales archaeon]|nr:CubicO group peptidase, beta-lactamase class C family [Methanophagales archaeon]
MMKRQPLPPTKLMYSVFLAILVLLLAAPFTMAQGIPTKPNSDVPLVTNQQGPTDPRELEAFIDGVMAAQMEAYHIPGATISVVKDGKLFFAKGYGYADLESRKPVIANESLFRVGSVSKLFTWTAVMQLAEQGKLDLNADLNIYLTDFKIPDTYPEPITLAHLMTHTAGFEDHGRIFARSADDVKPLGEYLADNMPARVRSPGEFTAYSNHGTALAGYIVEEVSGMPFDDYIEENIYKPLDMQHSTFRQPIPPELAPNMAMGYTYKNGAYKAEEFEYLNGLMPAGSMSATSTDIANFMIAHLEDGRYGGVRILQEATAQEMHRWHFTHDPRINGMCYGFYEGHLNNQKIIEHGGDTIYFHSLLVLLPEENVGLFVSFNSIDTEPENPLGGARVELLQAFLDRYYPIPDSSSLQPPADFQQRAGQLTGSYGITRTVYTTYEKLMGIMMKFDVSATEDGLIFLSKQWVEVEPMVFHEVGGQQTLVFREDSQGCITHMFVSGWPVMAFVKLAWYEASMFHYILLSVSMVLFLSVLAWPIGALRNRLKGKKKAGILRSRQARWVAGGMSALYVLFLIGMVIVLSDTTSPMYGVPPLLPFVLVLPLLAAVLTIGALCFTMLAWKNRYWGVVGRVHYTVVTVAALGFIWFLNYWNLLGFRF